MVHAARRLTSIEFSFDPCNIYCDGPRGVGYQADTRSVGDSHPSCYFFFSLFISASICDWFCLFFMLITNNSLNNVCVLQYKNLTFTVYCISYPAFCVAVFDVHINCIFYIYWLCKLLIVRLIKLVNLTVITYNAVGQLWCTICNCPVKTNLLWNSHIQGRTHREVTITDVKR